ncbi:MAG TPA: CRTAC1 family protein, partial [Thermoanaerobaculia bacterium]|nr:CRTAC1 family protein [Thermoanaerobaculia bacterium]
GSGTFEDRSQESRLGMPSFPYTGFGVGLLDYDGDGVLDLFVANGAVTLVQEQVRAGSKLPLAQPNQLFRGLGDGRFEEVTAEAGEVFGLEEVSRGVAVGDVDNDGDADLLVANSAGLARLLLNQVGQDRPWIGLRLVTGDPPRDALGARVALHRDGAPTLCRQVATDGSYASAGDPRALFGLGQGSKVTQVVVRWPSGRVEEFPAPPVGAYTTLAEGTGKPVG